MLKHPDLTRDRIRGALPKIEALIHPDRHAIEVGIWNVGDEPVPAKEAFQAEYQNFAVGERWGASWDTTWFRLKGLVPKAWKGREVVVLMRLGDKATEGFTAEGLIYRGGKVVRALNVNRADIEVAAAAKGGEAFEFFVEAGANGGSDPTGVQGEGLNLPDYGGRPRFVLKQAELATVNREAFDFYFDFKVAAEAMDAMEDSPRRGELLYTLNAVLNVLDVADPATIRPARTLLKKVYAQKNGPTVHRMSGIGHAHIDTAWLWPLRETIRKCARTFSTALDYMDKYPDYVFGCSQPQQYDWMKAYYPEIFARIRRAVKRGQWEPIGSMWIETDCNLASGESLVRQLLLGKKFFQDEFEFETKDVWIPDVFGYAASMPQIMRKAGTEWFLTQKMSWSQFNKFPHHTFEWEGIDGTRIFTHFPPAGTYNADTGPRQLIDASKNFREHDRASRSLLVYGYGDGGGGPSIAMLEQAKRVKDFEGVPPLELEPVQSFFKKAVKDARDLPVWVGELYLELHRGTYTSQARNKLGNRKSEFLLRDAEFFDVLSKALVPGRKETAVDPARAVYDVTGLGGKNANRHAVALDRAWKLVLLNQFHDIIPGSSIHWVYQDSERDYATIRELGESVLGSSLAALAPKVDTGDAVEPVFVGNTLGFRRREVIELPNGSLVPVDVPPCGYLVVDTADKSLATVTEPVVTKTVGRAIVLENGILRARIAANGRLSSLVHLATKRDAIVSGASGNVFQLHPDVPNMWDAWDVDVFYREKVQDLDGVESMKVLEEGPLRAVVRVVRSFGASRIEQDIILRAGSPRLDFVTTVDWHESQKLLKVAFPVNVLSPRATYEIQFGHLERPTHFNTSWDMARFEVCAQKWADLSESGFGVALLNDCKYGHDIHKNVMRLSLLRAPVSPDPVADRGRHVFTYAVMPHGGDFRSAGVIEEAYALNVPLLVRDIAPSSGSLPASQSFFHVDNPAVVIEAVKVSEDGHDVVVRLYEARGSRGQVALSTSLPVRRASTANLLEQVETPLKLANGTVRLAFSPFEILTVRLHL